MLLVKILIILQNCVCVADFPLMVPSELVGVSDVVDVFSVVVVPSELVGV